MPAPLQLCSVCPLDPDSLVFSPRNIAAGVGDVLTVRPYYRGKPCTGYFGSTKGNIQFRDANLPHNSTTNAPLFVNKIDSTDVLIWNDSIVKVKVPSMYFQDSVSRSGCAGSGQFFVKPNGIPAKLTASKLHIPYAALNYLTPTG
jgi:hypothetical protein